MNHSPSNPQQPIHSLRETHPKRWCATEPGLCLRLRVAHLARSHGGGELALSAGLLDVAGLSGVSHRKDGGIWRKLSALPFF